MEDIVEVFDRHGFGVLHYSGGKDSTACLFLLREYWKRLTVLWINTGDAYPELQSTICSNMEMLTVSGGKFIEVRSDVRSNIIQDGFPTDLLPADNTAVGRYVNGGKDRILLQGRYDCCNSNMWKPLHEATKALNPTLIIRGVRQEEIHKPPTNNFGDGIEYWYPIYDWSEERVISYLLDIGKLPKNYEYTSSSLDCMHCTAYWAELKAGKLEYLKAYHPETFRLVENRLKYMINTSLKDLMLLKELGSG